MIDQKRTGAILRSIMLPVELASIIEEYDGHFVLLRTLIEHMAQQCAKNLLCESDRADQLYLRYLPCIEFPFCNPIDCIECRGILSYADRSFMDVWFDEMQVETILMWMINGGIGWTYTGQPMIDWFAERINALMRTAYTIIHERAVKYVESNQLMSKFATTVRMH